MPRSYVHGLFSEIGMHRSTINPDPSGTFVMSSFMYATARDWARFGLLRTVPLPTPVPVHLLYWTAWADQNGTVHFRNDVYHRDAPVDRALRAEPPSGPPP